MSSLIVLHQVRVENANAIAGLTYGFPRSPIFWATAMRYHVNCNPVTV